MGNFLEEFSVFLLFYQLVGNPGAYLFKTGKKGSVNGTDAAMFIIIAEYLAKNC